MKDSMVEQYFERVEREDDLKLPPRNNLPALGIAKLWSGEGDGALLFTSVGKKKENKCNNTCVE